MQNDKINEIIIKITKFISILKDKNISNNCR